MASSTVSLSSPRLNVILGDPTQPPESWRAEEVQTIGRDLVSAETLFGVRKFGRTQDHPVRSLVAMAYAALIRTGKYEGPFDKFEADYIEVQPVGADEAFPTEPGPEPG